MKIYSINNLQDFDDFKQAVLNKEGEPQKYNKNEGYSYRLEKTDFLFNICYLSNEFQNFIKSHKLSFHSLSGPPVNWIGIHISDLDEK